MTVKGAVCVAPDAPLARRRQRLSAHGVRRLLVADSAGQLLGIVALSDVSPPSSDRAVGAVLTDLKQQS